MCGISVYFGPKDIKQETIFKTIKSLAKRGPDGNGFYKKTLSKKNIVLINTRLKIIDLSEKSNQPFRYDNSVLVYNGEIYNYLELKKELEALGHKFKTDGDTEVLIHSLREWGIEKALNKFEGMWAFAWFDEISKKLFLSRDRFGEKPLYFYRNNNSFYFASEIKNIASLINYFPEKNYKQLMRYLNFGYKSLNKKNETFYKGIFNFPKGYFETINENGSSKLIKYWNINKVKINKYSFKENCENIKDLLINSLRIRTRTDVPLAFCMSSGIDSNILFHISKKILKQDVHGFSINSADNRYSEKKTIQKSLKGESLKCFFVENSSKDFLNNLKKLIEYHDSPISTLTYYLHWLLLDKIKQKGFKVTLSGVGSDELFSGYYVHHNLYLADLFNQNKKLFKRELLNWKKYQSKIVTNKYLRDPKLFIKNPNFRSNIYQYREELKEFFKNPLKEKFQEKKFNNGILRNRMCNELFYENVPVVLHEEDHNNMFLSMENRAPFLDKALFEYSLSIPFDFLIGDGFAKNILRKSMKGLVPKVILNERKKIGFNASISEMLNFKNKKVKEFLLDDSEIFKFVDKNSISKILRKKTFKNGETQFIFNFINSKLFLKNELF